MQASLFPHPARPSIVPLAMEAGFERLSPTILRFRYLVRGPVAELVVPPVSAPLRADDLWRTTCFEAFLSPLEQPGYVELNFSPSSQWAAYAFTDYREGSTGAPLLSIPEIETSVTAGRLEVTATVSLEAAALACRVRLCAVIEERSGTLSYWADSHPGSRPDFHRQDCFTLQLPAASQA